VSRTETLCRSCGADTLDVFLSLGDLPLSDGFLTTEQLGEPERRYPLDVAFCNRCTLVQILETVPPEELFGADYPYFSSVSDTVVRNAEENVAARIEELGLGPGSLAVELASNDGYLLQFYARRGIPVLGIDPAPAPVAAAREKGIDTRCAFFGLEYARLLVAEGVRADVIHANNVLAHVADTNGFVAGIALLLKPEGTAVIEVPYVRELIEHGEFDTIYHEHLCYFSVTALQALFRRHGLELVRVEPLPIHGGSLRIFVRHRGEPDDSVTRHLAEERARGMHELAYYRQFARKVQDIRDSLARLLADLKASGARIAGYGAAAKGTILLNCVGIGPETLDFVADRNPFKQGRWIPGVRLPIVPPERIRESKPDYLLILPWNFRDEIMAQQSEHARRGGRFIVPIPTPTVI